MDLTLDPATTALVMIDLQGGTTAMNLAPHASANIVARSVTIAKSLAGAGGVLVAVNVAFAADGKDRLSQPVDAGSAMPGSLPADWATLVPDVAALGAIAVTKRNWGAFHGTDLDLQLRRRGITTILLTGIATNFGVESTAREGWQLGYSLIVVEDACSSVSEDMHGFAIGKIMPRIARVRSTAQILAALPG